MKFNLPNPESSLLAALGEKEKSGPVAFTCHSTWEAGGRSGQTKPTLRLDLAHSESGVPVELTRPYPNGDGLSGSHQTVDLVTAVNLDTIPHTVTLALVNGEVEAPAVTFVLEPGQSWASA